MEKTKEAVGWKIKKDGKLLPKLFNNKEEAEGFTKSTEGAEVIEYMWVDDIYPGETYLED